jgi:pimeloyl-ACP methyl ester carboxylesterase
VTVRRVEVASGIELDVIDEGSGARGVAVLLHGFPESSHSWRHQVSPLVDAGWRVLVPDQRGYASSSAPPELSAYRGDILADDVIALLDDINADDAVIIGHDWGAIITWHWATSPIALSSPHRCECSLHPLASSPN